MKNKIKQRKKLIIIMIIALIIILFFIGFSFGKTYSKTDIQGSSEIAKPIMKVENSNKINITNQNQEGIYEFKIKNFEDENNITSVEMEYYIEILTDISDLIKIELYKNDQLIEIENNRTKTFNMVKDIKQEDKYKIRIKYNEKSNISMEDIIQELQIKVHSQQKQS